ncbi:MAG: hypothetical protein DCF20_00415 [Pseudanabaena sp.]|nr:MAG: hypothetical protein DCF20_00415 [Pseudanabaena sp.]
MTSSPKLVQSLLSGKSTEEKIEWLSAHGTITLKPKTQQNERQSFWFESPTKANCCFFLDDDEFVFMGEHATFQVSDR